MQKTADKNVNFIGSGIKLGEVFSEVSGKINCSEGVERINQSLRIISMTHKGEIPMLPFLGSSLDETLFENINDATKLKCELALSDAYTKQEPRITVENILITEGDNALYCSVNYSLTNTDMRGLFNYKMVSETM